jgi:uncharacterized membrane protein YgaE (UPF0421/DUF939 family)
MKYYIGWVLAFLIAFLITNSINNALVVFFWYAVFVIPMSYLFEWYRAKRQLGMEKIGL